MPITVYPDRIQFNNYALKINSSGLVVTNNGKFISSELGTTPSSQGTQYGFSAGGVYSPFPPVIAQIDRFGFATASVQNAIGNLTLARSEATGQSSAVSGYTSGGASNIIDKFPFASNANATDVGDLTVSRGRFAGHSSSVNGYASGGGSPGSFLNTIDKFPFATDSNATDVGDLSVGRSAVVGQSSTVSGYSSGGISGISTDSNVIDKFPFASDANATDVGDLIVIRSFGVGNSSQVSGYISFGTVNTIEKFSFATDSNSTSVGLAPTVVSRVGMVGHSSLDRAYASGGPAPIQGQEIYLFPFATDANATQPFSLGIAKGFPAGHQI